MREMNIATKHNALQHAVEQMLEHGPRELPQITTLRTDPDLEMLTIGTANVRAEIDHDVYGFGYSAQLIDANGQTIGALIADDAGRVHLTGAEAANHLADIQAIANGLGALQVYQTRSDLLTVPLHIAPEVLPDVLAVSERVCSNIERLADITPAQRSLSVALVDRELPAVAGLIEARTQQLVELDVRRDAFLAEVRRGMVLMTPYLAEIERMPRLTDAERSNIGQAMLTWCVERAAIHAEQARNWQFAWGAADQSFKLRDDQIRLLTDILAQVHHDGQGIHFKATDSYPDAIYERSFLEQLRSLKGDPRDRLAENAEAMQWQLEAVMETRPRTRQTENDPIWSTVAEDILGAEAFQRVRQHGASVNDFASIPLTDIDALANNVLAHEPASVRLRNAAEDLVKLVAETREALAEVQPQNPSRRVLTEAEIKEWDRLTAPVQEQRQPLAQIRLERLQGVERDFDRNMADAYRKAGIDPYISQSVEQSGLDSIDENSVYDHPDKRTNPDPIHRVTIADREVFEEIQAEQRANFYRDYAESMDSLEQDHLYKVENVLAEWHGDVAMYPLEENWTEEQLARLQDLDVAKAQQKAALIQERKDFDRKQAEELKAFEQRLAQENDHG